MSVVATRTRDVVGEYEELRAWLAAAAATGRLTADGLLASGRLPDGRYWARVRLLEARPPRRRVRRGVVVAGVTVAAVVLVVAGWLIALAVAWVVAHVWQIVAVLIVVALGMAGLGRVGVCPGIHCPGCRHR